MKSLNHNFVNFQIDGIYLTKNVRIALFSSGLLLANGIRYTHYYYVAETKYDLSQPPDVNTLMFGPTTTYYCYVDLQAMTTSSRSATVCGRFKQEDRSRKGWKRADVCSSTNQSVTADRLHKWRSIEFRNADDRPNYYT